MLYLISKLIFRNDDRATVLEQAVRKLSASLEKSYAILDERHLSYHNDKEKVDRKLSDHGIMLKDLMERLDDLEDGLEDLPN